jgi:hypothetical protein
MEIGKSSMERAFELARSGDFESLERLVSRLNREGYDGGQLNGSQLRKQLSRLIKDASKPSSNEPAPENVKTFIGRSWREKRPLLKCRTTGVAKLDQTSF